jgi:hypothetical protein
VPPSLPLAPEAPTPLDAFERREQWRFAVLVLALVAAAGGVVASEGSVTGAGGGSAGVSPRTLGGAPDRRRSGRQIRPPRSC